MLSMIWWFQALLIVSGLLCLTAKPVQNENQEQSAVRRLDTLAGLTIGTSKTARSLPQYPRRTLDTLGDANFLRSLDSLGGANYLRSLDSLGNANILRDLDSIEGANFLRALDSLGGGNLLRHAPPADGFDYRALDSLGGANLLRREPSKPSSAHSGKRLDTLSGITLGHQKRTFDEVDRTAFDGFNKRNFDEIDRVGFDGFAKRNARNINASS